MLQTVELPFGDIYTGNTKNAKPHGIGKIKFNNGFTFEGMFEAGAATLFGSFTDQFGHLLTGTHRVEYLDLMRYEGEFAMGQPNGKGKSFSCDG